MARMAGINRDREQAAERARDRLTVTRLEPRLPQQSPGTAPPAGSRPMPRRPAPTPVGGSRHDNGISRPQSDVLIESFAVGDVVVPEQITDLTPLLHTQNHDAALVRILPEAAGQRSTARRSTVRSADTPGLEDAAGDIDAAAVDARTTTLTMAGSATNLAAFSATRSLSCSVVSPAACTSLSTGRVIRPSGRTTTSDDSSLSRQNSTARTSPAPIRYPAAPRRQSTAQPAAPPDACWRAVSAHPEPPATQWTER